MTYETIGWCAVTYYGATLILAIILSITFDKKLHQNRPEVLPFKWGYYTAWMAVFNSIPVLFLGISTSETITLALGMILLFAGLMIVLKRNRWALIALTILWINPIIWIINGIYIRNRWHE